MGVLTEEEKRGYNNVYIGHAAHKDHLNWSWKFKMWRLDRQKKRLHRHLVKWVAGTFGISPKSIKDFYSNSTIFVDGDTIRFHGVFSEHEKRDD